MRRISVACAALGLAVSALAAITPAKANPFHVIRWADTGYCQIWDNGIQTAPWPGSYHVVTRQIPTFGGALDVKYRMLHAGKCSF